MKRIIEATGGEVVSLTANFRGDGTACRVDQRAASPDGSLKPPTEFAPVYSSLEVGRVDERAGDLAGLLRAHGRRGEQRGNPGKRKSARGADRSATLSIPVARFPARRGSTTSPNPHSRAIS